MIEQANHLTQRGHRVVLLTPRGLEPQWIDVRSCVSDRLSARSRIDAGDIVVFSWDYDIEYALDLGGEVYYLVQDYVHKLDDIFLLPISGFISVSEGVQSHLRQDFGIESYLVPPGIDHKVFRPVSRVARCRNRVMALDRRARQGKGFEAAVQAIKRAQEEHPGIELLAIDGASPIEMATLYSSSWVFLSPSHHDGLVLSVVEAMACGCAVVTTKHKGVENLAVDGETALLVPIGDVEAMAEAVSRLVSDPGLHRKLVKNGFKIASQFQWEKSIDILEHALAQAQVPDAATALTQVAQLTPREVSALEGRLRRACKRYSIRNSDPLLSSFYSLYMLAFNLVSRLRVRTGCGPAGHVGHGRGR